MEVKSLSCFRLGLKGKFAPLPNPLHQGEGLKEKSVKQADRPDSVHLGLLAKTST